MANRLVEYSPSSKFLWKIENFSKLENGHYSDIFMAGGCKWRVCIYPKKESGKDFLSIYLHSVDLAKLPCAGYSFAILNQSSKKTVRRETTRHFSKRGDASWGFAKFLAHSELNDPGKGFIVNDTCVVEVELSVCRMADNSTADPMNKVVSSNQNEPVPQVVVPVKGSIPIADNDVVQVSEPEPKRQKKLDGKRNEAGKHPGSGQPFGEGGHSCHGVVLGENFENIGGFSVLKKQSSLYKQIWLTYGHISSSQILKSLSYMSQVWVLSDIMNAVMDMHCCRFADVSFEMIGLWEEKIEMAEKLHFNIRWLRECFENVKKGFNGMQRLRTVLTEKGQALRAAKAQIITAEDELNKLQKQLPTINKRTPIQQIEMERNLANGYHIKVEETQVVAAEVDLKKAQLLFTATKDELRNDMSELLLELEIEKYLHKGNSLLFDEIF